MQTGIKEAVKVILSNDLNYSQKVEVTREHWHYFFGSLETPQWNAISDRAIHDLYPQLRCRAFEHDVNTRLENIESVLWGKKKS